MTCQYCGYSETSVLFDKLLSFSEKMSYLGLTHESKQVGYVDATVHPDLSIGDFGINSSGPSYNKTNLDWFDKMIDEEPAKVKQAIINSDKLDNHTKPPFLTVQKLTARLLELSK